MGDTLASEVCWGGVHIFVDLPYVVTADVFDPFLPMGRLGVLYCSSEVLADSSIFLVCRVVEEASPLEVLIVGTVFLLAFTGEFLGPPALEMGRLPGSFM